jgi:hypothetical protein
MKISAIFSFVFLAFISVDGLAANDREEKKNPRESIADIIAQVQKELNKPSVMEAKIDREEKKNPKESIGEIIAEVQQDLRRGN